MSSDQATAFWKERAKKSEALVITLTNERRQVDAIRAALVDALEAAAVALETTADFVAGVYNAGGVEPYVSHESATVQGIRYDAKLARAALKLAKETP